jgi:hypothetical protein
VLTKMGQTRQVGRVTHKTYTQHSEISKMHNKLSIVVDSQDWV